ncbi:hypothetical protein [Roseitranquillus sediminis]|uniref:hypothetical protein n=1 Tax=Roseitranquillus sediminis TaxID=2809051 RepID=UPI001D0C3462|nr:hypothetical protein [Roseitranquillus sediminis]MBM9593384.1 hypothetical protein [Roseitranquillus sediminis]
MEWQALARNWPSFFPAIEDRWPDADEADLIEIDGDRGRFTDYVARISDTSRADAGDQVEAWLLELTDVPLDVQMDDRRDNANISESARSIPAGEDVYSEDGRFGSGADEDEGGGPVNPLGRTN